MSWLHGTKNWSRMNISDVTSNDKFGLPWHGRYPYLADVVGVAGPYRRSDGRRAPNLGPTSGGARALPEVDLVVAVQLLVVVSGRERLVAEFQGGRSPNAFFIFVHWATGEQLKREPGREIEVFFASRLFKKIVESANLVLISIRKSRNLIVHYRRRIMNLVDWRVSLIDRILITRNLEHQTQSSYVQKCFSVALRWTSPWENRSHNSFRN